LASASDIRPSGTAWADLAPSTRDRFFFLLVALAPAIFAFLTFNPSSSELLLQSFIRSYSIPIVAIEVAVLIYALTAGCSPLRNARSFAPWMRIALGMLIAIAVVTASFVAVVPLASLLRTLTLIVHLLFGLSIAWLMTGRWNDLKPLFWPAIAVGGVAYILIVAALIFSVPAASDFNWLRFGLGVTNIRQTGFYSIVGAGAALGLATQARRPQTYCLGVAAASLFTALSFWSGTRSSLIAIAGAFVVGFVLLPAMRGKNSVFAFAFSFVGGAALSLLHVVPDGHYSILRISNSLTKSTVEELGSNRLSMWLGTLRMIPERPLFGHGESQFRYLVPEAMGGFNHPHNIVLQILFQWGMVGAICFFALGAALLLRVRSRAAANSHDAAPAFLVLIGLLIMSLYEGSFYHPYPIMMIAVSLAFLLTLQSGKTVLGSSKLP
jgi:O-antigen ligase